MTPNKPLTIMIADDDADDREVLRFLFTKNDRFELINCFESGIDVIKEIMVENNLPDILLIDMYMPMLTGAEIIKKLEESKIGVNMYKFVVSSTINSAAESKYIENNKVKFIKKPVSLKEINDLPGIILDHLHYDNNTKV
ncbi:response regulator [Flavobacterium sp.]|uniref:response regulator n=1 Tax=Flavobacterium sp. TaxID=239 RepID=UPI0024874DAE|nr:response regulator [Flavobacterium sp.]MDI1317395.1 response regulator [Flavobacterium sp.]